MSAMHELRSKVIATLRPKRKASDAGERTPPPQGQNASEARPIAQNRSTRRKAARNANARGIAKRGRKTRPLNLNTGSEVTLVDTQSAEEASVYPVKLDRCVSSTKRKYSVSIEAADEPIIASPEKKFKHVGVASDPSADSTNLSVNRNTLKKKINKGNRRHNRWKAKVMKIELSKPFLVTIPLEDVSKLPGHSVSGHFVTTDLNLNNIVPATLDDVWSSQTAKTVHQHMKLPLNFDESCRTAVEKLQQSVGDRAASKFMVPNRAEVPILSQPDSGYAGSMADEHRVVGMKVLEAIQDALKDVKVPQSWESSQNSQDNIKFLLEPVVASLSLTDTTVTNALPWKGSGETISLKSSLDSKTHGYRPISDVAIVQVLKGGTRRILSAIEAFSGPKTNRSDPADRVRLILQGAYLSRKESTPSVLFYLAQDKFIETILVFPADSNTSRDQKFYYYVERKPFYLPESRAELLCEVVNLIWTQRNH